MKTSVKETWQIVWRLALAHHPLCGTFSGDTFGSRAKVCQGCVLGWPAFWVSVIASLILRGQGIDSWILIVAGISLGIPYLVLGPTSIAKGKWPRHTAKLLGGLGLGALAVGGLSLGWPWWAVTISILGVLGPLLYINWRRTMAMLAKCDACAWRRNWNACPGFEPPTNANAVPYPYAHTWQLVDEPRDS